MYTEQVTSDDFFANVETKDYNVMIHGKKNFGNLRNII